MRFLIEMNVKPLSGEPGRTHQQLYEFLMEDLDQIIHVPDEEGDVSDYSIYVTRVEELP